MKIGGVIMLFVSASTLYCPGLPAVPEVSPASGAAAVALVSGAILVIRGRRKK
jgi:hypothetical protein